MNSKRLLKMFFSLTTQSSVRGFKKDLKKIGKIQEEVKLEVEKDAKKLVSHVCGTNLLIEGGEDVKIKPDSEYPEWLWEIYTGPAIPTRNLHPNTMQYWNRIRKAGKNKEVFLRSLQKNRTIQK